MRASIVGLTVLVAAASPAAAQSKDVKAKAKALYESGLKHYNLAEYPEAIKDWKDAYGLTKKPLLLFNIGQAYRLSGDCKLAGTFYDSYQREEPNPKNQDELDQALQLCAKAEKPADKPVDTKKPVDSKKPVDTKVVVPVKQPIADAPSKAPKVADSGETEGEVDEPEPAATSSGGGLRKVGIGVAVAGLVTGGLGVYFAIDSGSIASDLEKKTEWTQTEIDLEAKGKSHAKLGWILGGTGVAAIAAGAVMIAIGGPKATESSTVSIVPTRGGAAVGWSFGF